MSKRNRSQLGLQHFQADVCVAGIGGGVGMIAKLLADSHVNAGLGEGRVKRVAEHVRAEVADAGGGGDSAAHLGEVSVPAGPGPLCSVAAEEVPSRRRCLATLQTLPYRLMHRRASAALASVF